MPPPMRSAKTEALYDLIEANFKSCVISTGSIELKKKAILTLNARTVANMCDDPFPYIAYCIGSCLVSLLPCCSTFLISVLVQYFFTATYM